MLRFACHFINRQFITSVRDNYGSYMEMKWSSITHIMIVFFMLVFFVFSINLHNDNLTKSNYTFKYDIENII